MMPIGSRSIDPEDILGTPENAAYHTRDRHPGVANALAWLAFSHLPEPLKVASRPLYEAALTLISEITTDSAELITALKRLVETKDWAVRACVRKTTGVPGPMARPAEIVDPPTFGNYGAGQIRPRPIKDNPQG